MTDGTRSLDAHARIAELEMQLAKLEVELKAEREQRQETQAGMAQLEAEFKSTRTQFALAERTARVGYWRHTLQDNRLTWSPGIYCLFGMDPTGPVPTAESIFSNENEETGRGYMEKRAAAIRTRSSFSHRICISCADGMVRIFDIHAKVEIGPAGDVVAIVGATHDVTQQVSIEAERNKALKFQRMMTEAASDIITVHRVHDGQGKAEFASAALGRMLGWTLRNLESNEFFKLVHPDDLAEVAKLREIPPSGISVTATYRLRHADGYYRWIEGTFTTVYDEETGEILYRIGVLRDVSERKAHELVMQEAREAAEAANRTKSTFLANMSHELRTPLNAIIGFADVMGHEMFGPIDNPRYYDYVSVIHKSGQHLLELITDILDMAKIEAGKFELNLEIMNLAETVGECAQIMAERAASAGVSVNVSLPAQDPTCRADRRAVKQIILNLLSNAVKFTPTGGHVEVTATITGNQVRIEVRDDGIGIAPEHLPRLANPFEQVHDDPNLAKSGTGLGLALVRALTERHGGRLTIESPGQDGTIVTVEFPRFAADQEAAA